MDVIQRIQSENIERSFLHSIFGPHLLCEVGGTEATPIEDRTEFAMQRIYEHRRHEATLEATNGNV